MLFETVHHLKYSRGEQGIEILKYFILVIVYD